MPRNVIPSLTEWQPQGNVAKVWTRVQNFERTDRKREEQLLTRVFQEIEQHLQHSGGVPLRAVAAGWKPQLPAHRNPEATIPCRVIELGPGVEAVCSMLFDGYEVPRVSFPAWVLRAKGLQVGSRFLWLLRHSERILPADVDPNVPQSGDSGFTE